MASVDIVVPCYNYARYLRRCIDTVLTQEGVDVRVLIIDDASTDETPDVGTDLAAKDARVEYRRHKTNLRHIATYNEGLIDWAKADYSLLLSADDLLAPRALLRATRVMDRHADVHMAYGMALLFCEESDLANIDESISTGSDSADYRLIPGSDFVRTCVVGNPVPTPSAIVRTKMQQRVGGYSATLPHTADMEMWMRFACYGAVGIVPDVLAYKRTHTMNMSTQYSDRPLGDFRERVEACRELLASHGRALGSAAPSLDEIHKLIADQVFWSASAFADEGHRKACDEALQFAIELWPRIEQSAQWRRLKLKCLLPDSIRRYLLGRSGNELATFQTGTSKCRKIGWWPQKSPAS